MNEDEHRACLAVERTRLANERTLLAYIRTALALAAGGAGLLQFFPSHPFLFVIAWLLMIFGAVAGINGARRFVVARKLINAGAAK